MTYQQLITILRKTYDAGEAQAIARLLADKLCGISFADLLCSADIEISEDILRRIEEGEPIQYILGRETFFGREFEVGEGVLIPRPETEELCQWIIDSAKVDAQDSTLRIMDIGTGSGAIAITLAKELPSAEVYAMDISDKALQYAQKNAEQNDVNVRFIKQDILKQDEENEQKYDVIVSNPPYIMNKEREEMSAHVVEHEPGIALFVPDNDPLLFYRAIADYAAKHIVPGGKLFFEINPLCANEMREMLAAKGFTGIEIREDEYGKKRMMRAELGSEHGAIAPGTGAY